MCSVAQEWARDKPDVVPGVLVLVEDFANFDRIFLSSLFQVFWERERERKREKERERRKKKGGGRLQEMVVGGGWLP
jgi:hypothetical protein